MSGHNMPCAKHEDLRELGNMTEDMLEANAIERATARPHSAFPFNRLPREIIAEIFCNCIHEPRKAVWMSTSHAPLLLCRVCSSWRALAQSTPELWASIGVRLHHQNDVDPLIFTRIVNTWLERSGTLPLTVTIEHIDYGDPLTKPTAVFDAILAVVCSHSSRWQNVDITAWLPVSFPRLRLETLPLLREFHLQIFIPREFKKAISLPFSESPRLTRLSWPHPLDALRNPRIPWSQISHLYISSETTFFAALETIRLCPQLEDFITVLIGGDRHPTIVENRRLRTLEISLRADCSPFFDSLILPELSEFVLIGETSDGTTTSGRRAFLDLLTRSNCKLYKLDLYFCPFGPLIECLEHEGFKSIQELKIEDRPHFTDNELIGLTNFLSPGPRVLLPKLTHLTLYNCLYASQGMLAEMVLSRRRRRDGHEAEPLQYLRVINHELYGEDVNSIKDEVKDGFDGDILYSIICENGERISHYEEEDFEG